MVAAAGVKLPDRFVLAIGNVHPRKNIPRLIRAVAALRSSGFADLELGMLRQVGLLPHGTPIITTVHGLQLVDDARLPMQRHDSALDWIVTPDQVIETHTPYPQPTGIDWDAVQPDQYQSIPALQALRPTPGSSA